MDNYFIQCAPLTHDGHALVPSQNYNPQHYHYNHHHHHQQQQQQQQQQLNFELLQSYALPKRSSSNSKEAERRSQISPFDPAANVPLPYQLCDDYGFSPFGASSVWKRNERERQRVRCVNDGYERLREMLPLYEKDKRVSKVDILRLAIRYIRHLEKVLKNENHWKTCSCFSQFQYQNAIGSNAKSK